MEREDLSYSDAVCMVTAGGEHVIIDNGPWEQISDARSLEIRARSLQIQEFLASRVLRYLGRVPRVDEVLVVNAIELLHGGRVQVRHQDLQRLVSRARRLTAALRSVMYRNL